MSEDLPTFEPTFAQLMAQLYGLLGPVKSNDAAGMYLRRLGLQRHASLRTIVTDGLPLDIKDFSAHAVLAAPVVTPEGEICGLGGRWLTEEGQRAGKWPDNVFWFSRRAGAAVRFGEPENHLALTVEIEAGLRIASRYAMPCWCSVVPWHLEDIQVPEGVENITVFADDDVLPAQCVDRTRMWLERKGHTVDIESTWGLLQ